MDAETAQKVEDAINLLVDLCHGAAFKAGWWINPETKLPRVTDLTKRQGLLEYAACMMNTHGEISEGWEGARKGNKPSDHIPEFSFAEEENADAIIRIFDTSGAFGFRLAKAVVAKIMFNGARADHKPEARAGEGGKRV